MTMSKPTVKTVLPRIGLPELMARFDCDSKCREFLEKLRWPSGPVCPKCGKKEIARVVNRDAVLRCTDCQTQFTVTAGTVFNDSHLPLSRWFIATFLLCESKKGVSALQIQRILKIGGHLVLTTPNIVSLRALAGILQGFHPMLFPAYIRPNADGPTDARHNREYTPREIDALLEISGFETTLIDLIEAIEQRAIEVQHTEESIGSRCWIRLVHFF